MQNTLYYGEICAMIAGYIHSDPADVKYFNNQVLKRGDDNECVFTLCAEAARIFDNIENGCCEHFFDAPKAIERYARELKKYLMQGKCPWALELYALAVRSIQETL